MAKRAKKERLKQFRQDGKLLKKKYSNGEMAKKLGVDAANLSSYFTGTSKNPGEDFINRFYMVFDKDIEEMKNAGYEPESSSTDENVPSSIEEPALKYLPIDDRYEHIQTLRVTNEDLRINMGKVIEMGQTLAESNKSLAQSTETLVQNNQTLVRSNEKLVDAQLTIVDRLNNYFGATQKGDDKS